MQSTSPLIVLYSCKMMRMILTLHCETFVWSFSMYMYWKNAHVNVWQKSVFFLKKTQPFLNANGIYALCLQYQINNILQLTVSPLQIYLLITLELILERNHIHVNDIIQCSEREEKSILTQSLSLDPFKRKFY